MKHDKWNKEYMACITGLRTLRRDINVKFGIPPFAHDKGMRVSTEVRIWLDEDDGVNPGFKSGVFLLRSNRLLFQEEMGEKEMLALIKVQQAMHAWREEGAEFPTAQSLELLEPGFTATCEYRFHNGSKDIQTSA